ncbi:hypothetical protein [Nocardia sp. NPDC056000]|uniref:hypothetical protein n=1 Tax=Nocardia sp. NPDC056000 TaxID=3345674 RepID=UPI0035DB34D9
MILFGVVAAGVTACGDSGSDSSESASAPPIRTSCAAAAANGSVISTEVRLDVPFTLQLPKLEDWQAKPVEGDDSVLRLVAWPAGRTGSATITLGVSAPRSANISVVSAMAGDWKQWRNESVQVCGGGGNRFGGILPASDTRSVDLYREFLDFDYRAGEMVYPIKMRVDAPAADRDRYKSDIDTFVDGLQVVPTPPAG